MKKKVFSGIQPSGSLHIGNYLGAIKNWVASQDERDNIFCIVDMHAITVPQDPQELKKNIRELAAWFFACGIDPDKSALFVQSHIRAHTELGWILNCYTPMGWVQRMTQFKEKSAKQKDIVSVGLFGYPVLQAADILLYHADLVPVGEDQRQHVELTRDIAQRFNSIYGDTFTLPAVEIPEIGARIMGLDDPTKKMSKSDTGNSHAIFLGDEPDVIRKKIKGATTDSQTEIVFDESRPGVYNLLVLYELFSGEDRKQIEKSFAGKGYGEFKQGLAELVVDKLKPIRDRYKEFSDDPQQLDILLTAAADRIRPVAEQTLQDVKDKAGIG